MGGNLSNESLTEAEHSLHISIVLKSSQFEFNLC